MLLKIRLANLRMEDINLKERQTDVIRKLSKEDSFWTIPIALNNLEKDMEKECLLIN